MCGDEVGRKKKGMGNFEHRNLVIVGFETGSYVVKVGFEVTS